MTSKIHIAHCGLQNSLMYINISSLLAFMILETGISFMIYKLHFIGNKTDKYKLRINFSN